MINEYRRETIHRLFCIHLYCCGFFRSIFDSQTVMTVIELANENSTDFHVA